MSKIKIINRKMGAQNAGRRTAKANGNQAGFTLVELLVSLVLGLLILGGVISIFIETRRSFRVNENLGRMQENARFSFEVLSREIREAGSTPCGVRAMASVIHDGGTSPWYTDWSAGTIRGFDGDRDSPGIAAFGTAKGNRVAGTDALVILRNASDESVIRIVTDHNVGDKTFTTQTNPKTSYNNDDIISVCDSKSGAILQIDGATNSLINYGLASPPNCSLNLGYPTGNCTAPVPGKTFDAGAIVTKFDPVFWYIGVNERQGRSLYRVRPIFKTGALTTIAEEMIPSVQNLQVEYLTRDGAAGGALATTWANASAFDAVTGWSETNTTQVVAARLTVTFQSEEKVGTAGQSVLRNFVSVSAIRSRDFQ